MSWGYPRYQSMTGGHRPREREKKKKKKKKDRQRREGEVRKGTNGLLHDPASLEPHALGEGKEQCHVFMIFGYRYSMP